MRDYLCYSNKLFVNFPRINSAILTKDEDVAFIFYSRVAQKSPKFKFNFTTLSLFLKYSFHKVPSMMESMDMDKSITATTPLTMS